jgi:hypothetical protein
MPLDARAMSLGQFLPQRQYIRAIGTESFHDFLKMFASPGLQNKINGHDLQGLCDECPVVVYLKNVAAMAADDSGNTRQDSRQIARLHPHAGDLSVADKSPLDD